MLQIVFQHWAEVQLNQFKVARDFVGEMIFEHIDSDGQIGAFCEGE